MKRGLLVLAVGLALSAPAWGQTATDTLTKAATDAATDAATQAVNDGVSKVTGTGDAAASQGRKKVKQERDKSGPNWGQSEDHRQDGERGHKGKKGKKNKD